MVRTRRVSEGRTDAAVSFGDQILAREPLVAAVSPIASRAGVERLRRRFCQPVGQRLHHDRVVVVVIALERRDEIVGAEAGGHRKGADNVHDTAVPRRHEIGQRAVRLPVGNLFLLPQHVESNELTRGARFIQHDVVAVAVRRPESVDAARRQKPLADDVIEQRAGVIVQVARGRAVLRVIENRGKASLQLPRGKEQRPIDERGDLLERHVHQPRAREARRGYDVRTPGSQRPVRQSRLVGEERPTLERAVLLADLFLLLAVRAVEGGLLRRTEQARHDVHRARGVEHVHDRFAVLRSNLHGGVLAARRRPPDEERYGEAAALHLPRHEDHLVKRRGDQAAQSDDIRLLVDRGLQDRVRRDHHAEIHDLVIVAAEDDADDVLTDVVDVALDGREHDL